MPIEEGQIALTVISLLIGVILNFSINKIMDIDKKVSEIKNAIDNLDLDRAEGDTDKLNEIKELLVELRGMVNVLAVGYREPK